MKKLDKYIIILFVATFVFTVGMIWIFLDRSYIPDTLVQCYFTYVVGELLACALIKTVGEHKASRQETLEDREYYDKKEKEIP